MKRCRERRLETREETREGEGERESARCGAIDVASVVPRLDGVTRTHAGRRSPRVRTRGGTREQIREGLAERLGGC